MPATRGFANGPKHIAVTFCRPTRWGFALRRWAPFTLARGARRPMDQNFCHRRINCTHVLLKFLWTTSFLRVAVRHSSWASPDATATAGSNAASAWYCILGQIPPRALVSLTLHVAKASARCLQAILAGTHGCAPYGRTCLGMVSDVRRSIVSG